MCFLGSVALNELLSCLNNLGFMRQNQFYCFKNCGLTLYLLGTFASFYSDLPSVILPCQLLNCRV